MKAIMTMPNFPDIAPKLRADIVQMSYKAKATHLASALSCVDISTVLYAKVLNIDPAQPQHSVRDRFILSKGHAAAALYAALAWKGLISPDQLLT